MQLYGALILFLTLSTACGLKCYTCADTDPKSCTKVITCSQLKPLHLHGSECFGNPPNNLTTKSCHNSDACVSPISCCEGDLCNNAIPTGPSVILLLVSSAIITLFL
ncbi:lymphocyte antigen 6S-like [Thunnus thynnus]|uniref:lymphocyte antigen 6S-like n=1 Tax=Thunnus thynnus TaxID=8237 RepID=UPI0035292CB0